MWPTAPPYWETISPHHHSFDHILGCTGPIFSKLKPLERTWDTSYAAKNMISLVSASTSYRSQCRAFVPNPKLMWYQQHGARCLFVHYTVRMEQCLRSQTNLPHGTTMMGGQHHCTITLLIISWAVLVRFSPNWNHWNGHEIHLMPRKARFTKWALPLTEVNAACLYQTKGWCGINDMERTAILYLTLSEWSNARAHKRMCPRAPPWWGDNITAPSLFWSYLALYWSDFLQIENTGTDMRYILCRKKQDSQNERFH